MRNIQTDSGYLLSTSEDHSIRLWENEGDKGTHIFAGHSDLVSGCAVIGDRLLASSSWD